MMEKSADGEMTYKGYKTFQEYLESERYTTNTIYFYEQLFGRNFASPGGQAAEEEFLKMVNLQKDDYVLDMGSGIGGQAFLMAKDHGARVLGIDIASCMVNLADERVKELNLPQVEFKLCDATKQEYPEASFDIIHSREVIGHITDRKALFKSFLSWLKPGGRLIISDYCVGAGEHSDIFKACVAQRGYALTTLDVYGKELESLGFVNVRVHDRTAYLESLLKSEIQKLEDMKEDLCKTSVKIYEEFIGNWRNKIQYVALDDHKWGWFSAEKAK